MKAFWQTLFRFSRSRVDNLLSIYGGLDWLTQQRARALLFINLIVLVSALLDGVLSSIMIQEVTPSTLSDAVLFSGSLLALISLLKGKHDRAVNITMLVATIGLTLARILSTGKFSAEVSYD